MEFAALLFGPMEAVHLSMIQHFIPLPPDTQGSELTQIIAADAIMAILVMAIYLFLCTFKGRILSPTGYFVVLAGVFIAQSIALFATGSAPMNAIAENGITVAVLTATYLWRLRRERSQNVTS